MAHAVASWHEWTHIDTYLNLGCDPFLSESAQMRLFMLEPIGSILDGFALDVVDI